MIVILYVMDSLRPDFLSCYGYKKETSPNIDKMAEEGVIYKNSYSTASWTKPAAASLLTSQQPRTLNFMYEMDIMPFYKYSLQNYLKNNGFKTFLVSANGFISTDFGFNEFDEEINLYKDKNLMKRKNRKKSEFAKHINNKLGIEHGVIALSEDINEKIFKIIDENKEKNIFILAWSVDTHDPYFVIDDESYFGNSKEEYFDFFDIKNKKVTIEKLKSLYCDMIHYNDKQIGNLIRILKKENLYDNSMIIVTSDHGEAFGEHGETNHGGIVYEEKIRIPLIIKYPYGRKNGTYNGLSQLIDIYPTILDTLNITIPTEFEGFSLLIDNKKEYIFAETQMGPNKIYSAAVRKMNYKALKIKVPINFKAKKRILHNFFMKLRTEGIKFYNLESQNIDIKPKKDKKNEEKMNNLLSKIIEQLDNKMVKIENRNKSIDKKVKNRLKALGYFR